MTPAPAGSPSGPAPLFSMFSGQTKESYRSRGEAFLFSLAGQALVLALLIYFTCCALEGPPRFSGHVIRAEELPLIFSGTNGGGGGNFDKLPASHGNLPRPSLAPQLLNPNVMQPQEMPKLPLEETIMAPPEIKIPQGGQIGDPTSPFKDWLSNGPGKQGIGPSCCGGVGPSTGPYAGSGPPGLYPAGRGGVTVPVVIYNPEPMFSDEARKAKYQGMVQLLVVVGKDGHTYDIHVAQSLGMGLDEKAMEAVGQWRFKPATFNGQPVATRILVEVDFHLY
jgi:periplasmic protein TonB